MLPARLLEGEHDVDASPGLTASNVECWTRAHCRFLVQGALVRQSVANRGMVDAAQPKETEATTLLRTLVWHDTHIQDSGRVTMD